MSDTDNTENVITMKRAGLSRGKRSLAAGHNEELDLREVIAVVRTRWRRIAIITGAFVLLSVLYAFLAAPVYEADALIQIQQQNTLPISGSSSASTDLLSELLPVAAPAEAEIQIMQSRAVLQPVVDSQHLNIEISSSGIPIIRSIFGSYSSGRLEIDKLKVPEDWLDKSLTLNVLKGQRYTLSSPSGETILNGRLGVTAQTSDGRVTIRVTKLDLKAGDRVEVTRLPDQEAIYDLQQQVVAAEQGTDTGIVKLSMEGPDPVEDKRIVNAIVSQYLHENSSVMSEQARKSLNFISKQLPNIKRRADQTEAKLAEYQVKHGIVALDQQAQAYLQEALTLQQQLSQLELTKAALSQSYESNYPALKAIDHQISQTRSNISTVDSKIRNLPQKERGYLSLTRDAKVYEQLYVTLLSQSQDLKVAEAGAVGSAHLVNGAMTPIKPVRPHKALVIIAGLFLGLVVGIGFALLKRVLHHGVEDPSVLESEFELPVLAVIPHSDLQKSLTRKTRSGHHEVLPLLVAKAPGDIAVEAVQSLKTSLVFTLSEFDRKIVTFGGSSPGVGKTFLSVNAAHAMAQFSARSIIIDADLRRGHAHKYCGIRSVPGLSEYLLGKADVAKVVHRSSYSENVDCIPRGDFPLNPLELVSSLRMQDLIDQVSREYDYVFLDVPPILAVADALPITRQGTANILVVKAGVQSIQEIGYALQRFAHNGVRIQGFVINDLGGNASYYSGSVYGYSYAYKYDQDQK